MTVAARSLQLKTAISVPTCLVCAIMLLLAAVPERSEARTPGQPRFVAQPVVAFAGWTRPVRLTTRALTDHAVLLAVDEDPFSAACLAGDDCKPKVRLERWVLPGLERDGRSNDELALGDLIAADLTTGECFLLFADRLEITDSALRVTRRVPLPDALRARLRQGDDVFGVAATGRFVVIGSQLWDRARERWVSGPWRELISPDVVMGANRVMAAGSYSSGKLLVAAYARPESALSIRVPKLKHMALAPDERYLLVVERSGRHRLIDTQTGRQAARWTHRSHYTRIGWASNRALGVERNGAWELHQIEPHRRIARGQAAADAFALVADEAGVAVLLDPATGNADFMALQDGGSLGQQRLAELPRSHAWLEQDVPVTYSRRPLTLMLDAGQHADDVRRFLPYRLETR